ncbi:hypothetical protein DDE83_001167 [Stemphylium lycopersici]|uniref:Uncharacterized protein n=1 Tax=Stemphylium lycopersici TaxID=183478 RepID=A0A364NE28_STELY|nr:hypothetical protein DDE83_001167 [Stemphylium lycopersici]
MCQYSDYVTLYLVLMTADCVIVFKLKEHDHAEIDTTLVKGHHEADDAMRAYEGKYRYSLTNSEPNKIKEILGYTQLSPGFALKEVFEGRLRHMVHAEYEPVNSDVSSDSDTCVGSDVSDSAGILRCAEYIYSIDLPAQKLRVYQENWKNVGRWVVVPLRKDPGLSLCLDFEIFEVDRTRKIHAMQALREGRSWRQRADPELSRLAHFILHRDRKKKKRVLPNEVELREVLPEGSNRLPLRKEEWIKLRKAVMEIIKADHERDKEDLDLAPPYDEGERLKTWAAVRDHDRDKMGSLEEVEAVLTAL